MGSGGQFVMTCGPQLTLKLLAASWDLLVLYAGQQAAGEGESYKNNLIRLFQT